MRPTSGEVSHRCARYQRLVGISIDVRSWHFSDMHPHRRAFRKRTTISLEQCLVRNGHGGSKPCLESDRGGREMGRRASVNVCLWHEADIGFDAEHVRFRGQTGHL
jgi:hypothetical protein